MKKFICILLCLFVTNGLSAQGNQNPTILSVDGQFICLTSNTFDLNVLIRKFPYTGVVLEYTIDWGDGSSISTIQPGDTSRVPAHRYNLQNFFGTCNYEQSFIVELLTYRTPNDPQPLNNSFRVRFFNPPRANFTPNPSTACVGNAVQLIDQSCPTNSLTTTFAYGNGQSGANNSVSYTAPGTYNVTLTATNRCGSNTTVRPITVIQPAVAQARADSGVVTPVSTPIRVCLGTGAGGSTVRLSGAGSQNSTSYQWQLISGFSANFVGLTSGPTARIVFRNAGNYTVRLTTNNNCNQPSTQDLQFEVISAQALQLFPQPDACELLNYSPSPPLPSGASLTINGQSVSSFPFQISVTTTTQYTVLVQFTNACGAQTSRDSFLVTTPQNVAITSPATSSITVCQGSPNVTLTATPAGGTWSGRVSFVGNTPTFNTNILPSTYPLTYSFGSGNCFRQQTVNITLEAAQVLSLVPQQDTCNTLSYTPVPYQPSARYTVNGTVTNSFPITLGPGSYTLGATLTNACGSQTVTDNFSVITPQRVFIRTPRADTSICVGQSIRLLANLPGGTWLGSNITNPSASAVFQSSVTGTFQIIYRRGNGACEQSDTVNVNVQGVSATAQNLTVCPWSSLQTLVGTPSNGVWSSPDCPSCISFNTFSVNNYTGNLDTLRLTYQVTSSIGCGANANARVIIHRPIPQFSVGQACTNSLITVNSSSARGNSFIWRLDGNPIPAPPLQPLAAGAYSLEMVAIVGNCRDSSSSSIQVLPLPPSAAFVASSYVGCSGMTVTLGATAPEVAGVSYTWDINSDTPANLSTYNAGGTYTFTNTSDTIARYTIRFSTQNICATLRSDTVILVRPNPVAGIGIDSSRQGCTPLHSVLTNRNRGNPDTCYYQIVSRNFNRSFGCASFVPFTFTTRDTTTRYIISMTAINVCGTSQIFDTITVYPSGVRAFFNLADSRICANAPLRFQDASTPLPTRVRWDFGDGASANQTNAVHTFLDGQDSFKVVLYAYTPCGYDSLARTIYTRPEPIVNFDLPAYFCEKQLTTDIVNRSPTNYYQYLWQFSNGRKDSLTFNPVTRFNTGGVTESITLEVTDFSGCKNSVTKQVPIRQKPIASFVASETLGCQALNEVKFTNTSQFANGYQWTFDNGFSMTLENPTWSFDIGKHDIKLIANYDQKCFDTLVAEDVIVVEQCGLFIPTAFSPNDDGFNDNFTVFPTSNGTKVNQCRIFDRWGEEVFNISKPINLDGAVLKWDGTFNGEELNPAVFVYLIEVEFLSGATEFYSGEVTIIR